MALDEPLPLPFMPLTPLERQLLGALQGLEYQGCWCQVASAREDGPHSLACRKARKAVDSCRYRPQDYGSSS